MRQSGKCHHGKIVSDGNKQETRKKKMQLSPVLLAAVVVVHKL